MSIDLTLFLPTSVLVRVDAEEVNTGTLDVKLTDEEVKYLEEPYTPVKIAGHK